MVEFWGESTVAVAFFVAPISDEAIIMTHQRLSLNFSK